MRTHAQVARLVAEAEANRRCFRPHTNAERKAVDVRIRHGELVRPHRNVYARAEYWQTLNEKDRATHIIKTGAIAVFVGVGSLLSR